MFSTCARLLLTVFWVWFSFLIHFSLLGFRIFFFIWFLMFFLFGWFGFFWILVLYCRYWGCEDEGEIWLNSKCFSTCVCYMYIVFYIENFTRFLTHFTTCMYKVVYIENVVSVPQASTKSLLIPWLKRISGAWVSHVRVCVCIIYYIIYYRNI